MGRDYSLNLPVSSMRELIIQTKLPARILNWIEVEPCRQIQDLHEPVNWRQRVPDGPYRRGETGTNADWWKPLVR